MINPYQKSLVTARYNTASYTPNFLTTFGFIVLPLTENIGHPASIYVEEYSISSNLRSGDAIMAATAVKNNMILSSSNVKHFKVIKELKFKIFEP
jgi:predicted nucleic acid-binding protein